MLPFFFLWSLAVTTFLVRDFPRCALFSGMIPVALLLVYRKSYRQEDSYTRRLRLSSTLLGIVAGVGLFFLRQPTSIPQLSDTMVLRGSIRQISAASLVLHDASGLEWRISGMKTELRSNRDVSPGDSWQGSCRIIQPGKSVFHHLETLSGRKNCRFSAGTFQKKTDFFRDGRRRLKTRLEKSLSSDMMKAVFLSDPTFLDEDLLYWFRRTGTAHLFAASGLHLGLVYLFLAWPFARLGAPGTGKILGLAVSFLLLFLLDFRVSLLRAWVFLFLHLTSRSLGRNSSPLTTLWMTAGATEALQPASCFSVSFLFSFAITGALIVLVEPLRKLLPKSGFVRRRFFDNLSVSASAFLVASPLSRYFFGSASGMHLFHNLLSVPVFGIYLPLAGLSTFLPILQYPVQQLENFFFLILKLQILLDAALPVSENLNLISLLLFFPLLVLILYVRIRGRTLRARKFLPPLLLVPCLFILLIRFLPGHREKFRMEASSFLYSDGKTLHIRGKAPLAAIFRWEAPFRGISADEQEMRGKAGRFFSVTAAETGRPEYPLALGGRCFLRLHRIRPEWWRRDELRSCRHIHLFTGEKQGEVYSDPARRKAMETLFGWFGGRGSLHWHRTRRDYFP